VEVLLEKGTSLRSKIPSRSDAGCGGLRRDGHEAVVRLLIEKGAKVNSYGSRWSDALGWAAENGHEAVVRLLLESGANLHSNAPAGRTPLWWAARNGHEAVARLPAREWRQPAF